MADLTKMCIIKSHYGSRSKVLVYWYESEEVGDELMAKLYHSPSCPSSYDRIPMHRIEKVPPEMVRIEDSQAIFVGNPGPYHLSEPAWR